MRILWKNKVGSLPMKLCFQGNCGKLGFGVYCNKFRSSPLAMVVVMKYNHMLLYPCLDVQLWCTCMIHMEKLKLNVGMVHDELKV